MGEQILCVDGEFCLGSAFQARCTMFSWLGQRFFERVFVALIRWVFVLLWLGILELSAAHAASFASISQIQGRGARSPFEGVELSTQGVVSLLTERGFFMQDERGDGDALSSDGIYVHLARQPSVKAGDRVLVRGKVAEYAVGTGPQALAKPLTELVHPQIEVLASGIALQPTRIEFPEAVEGDLERYEGMLVSLPGPLTVVQNFFLGRYGQLTLASGGRLERPTNRYRAGSPEARALADENARRRIILDDASSRQNPDPVPYLREQSAVRVGDVTRELVGVIDFGLASSDPAGPADYRIHPAHKPVFVSANPRPSRPPDVGGDLRVASFNVLNYFTTLDQPGARCFPGGGRSDCRGADSEAELARQKAKILRALLALDADVLGLIEIENRGDAAVLDLVEALNAQMGAGTYASVGLPQGGTGRDAIRVAMIYKPARLKPLGPASSDSAPVHSRPPLAQSFVANGHRFNVVVAHFKSKSRCPQDAASADADQGDGQGCWNARRLAQARATRAFLQRLALQSGTQDVLMIGDLNAYGQEAPVLDLSAHGFVDQIRRYEDFAYSYVFDGESGNLDHALASSSLSPRVAGAAHWRINADEAVLLDYNLEFRQPACKRCAPDLYQPDPYRSSDHDPMVLGLRLGRP